MTAELVLRVIEGVVSKLASKFNIGYLERDDIAQDIRLWSIQALEKYDPARRPLENFLMVNARNRMLNLLRNTVRRNDFPCKACHDGHPCGADGEFCEAYAAWLERNNRKAALAGPCEATHMEATEPATRIEDGVEHQTEYKELVSLIDQKLPVELRADYLRMLASRKSVPRARRETVARAVQQILKEAGVDVPFPA